MKNFKEWISDNLRYFLLILVTAVAFFVIMGGVRLFQNAKKDDAGDAIQILTEKMTETETTTEAKTETESETQSETAKESETESETDAGTNPSAQSETGSSTRSDSENSTAAEVSAQSENRQNTAADSAESNGNTNSAMTSGESANAAGTQPETAAAQSETAPQTETERTPVYMTLTGSCYIRSYPDYGDNIIGEYTYGTTVEFLEDVGGWYKVQIDGMVGYMGARFFR